MQKGTFTFELVDKYPPDIVFKNSLKQIEEATNGYVIGQIEKYDGPVDSYSYTEISKPTTIFNQILSQSQPPETRTIHVDIQDELGEQQDVEQKNFEVFLTVKGLEHYKYRMMFVSYSIISYPVTIIMNEDLAIEYSGRRTGKFLIESMKQLNDMINTVLDSHTMISLIQNLINESLRQEQKPPNKESLAQRQATATRN